jgi:hypothetical protein
MITVYISIGNSDDQLTQLQWAAYCAEVRERFQEHSGQVYGEWHSLPNAPYQNACFAALFADEDAARLKRQLTGIRERRGQDAVAWATAETEMI